MKQIFNYIVFVLLLITTSEVSAKCRRVAVVKYQQQYGWSKKYTVEVTFMTGYELNQATRSYDYNFIFRLCNNILG
jgi:hypothetical protein